LTNSVSSSSATHSSKRSVLVTGGAGFIGSHLVDRLLARGDQVVVLDSFNTFYDPALKRRNVAEHLKQPGYTLIEGDLRDRVKVREALSHGPFEAVVHLAALAGVRPSLEQPAYYMDVNVNGTQILLEEVVYRKISRFVFGSSSSVYGRRSGEEFLESDRIDQPLSPYAASKAAGELLCYAAHHTYKLPVVCLRFFTVFGPRQRPDLAIRKFCRLIDEGQTVEVYGDGHSKRDYTYIDDIVSGIISALAYDLPGYDLINLGRSDPIELIEMIRQLESALGKSAKLVYKEVQMGEMPYTYASIRRARQSLNYQPQTPFAEGIKHFVEWYRQQPLAIPR
jgi:UDP-glucuronate 4-epimerase